MVSMHADVTALCYWKSEHNQQTCEDAYGFRTPDGLFAIADGAGTTLFSDLWASFLVQHFLHIPLLSDDPFEVEWWIRLAQAQFKCNLPEDALMPWNATQKAHEQGSHTTLATMRLSVCDATSAQAHLLAFGDSCILISRPTEERINSFPLHKADEFECAPLCLPSKASLFHRYFHRCQRATVALAPDDTIIMATDAVAKWIISAGAGHYRNSHEAFQVVAQQTNDSWAAFIETCRTSDTMYDDDSTALIITLQSDPSSSGTPLGTTTMHSQEVREERLHAFMQALNDRQQEQIALAYGDGADLELAHLPISQDQIVQARNVADALQEVITLLRQERHNPQIRAIMTSLWQKHAQILYDEPCAKNVCQTLKGLGVPTEPVSLPAPFVPNEAVPPLDDPLTILSTKVITLRTGDSLRWSQAAELEEN